MKKLLIALCTFISIGSSSAFAQCNGVFPANTTCGSVAGGIPGPVNNSVLVGNPGGTSGQTQYNNAGAFGGYTPSGDVAVVPSTGVETIQPGVVNSGKIATGGVATGNIAAGAVTNAKIAAGATNSIKSTLDGINTTDNAITTIFNALCTLSPATCVTFFGYANPIWYGADPTGVANSATAINAAAVGSKVVSMTAGGTYRVTSSVVMQPSQRLNCNGSTITQGNGDNVAILINAFSTVPNGSQIDHCVLDQNGANNTFGSNYVVDVSGPNNVTVEYNTIKNCTGGGIAIANSLYSIVEHNFISNCPSFGVAVINTTPGTNTYTGVRYNTMLGPMFHMIQVTQADHIDIVGNQLIQGNLIGDTSAPMRVTISGTALTWVSGPNFTNATFGMALVVNGGTEFTFASINSPTSITLATSGGSLVNVLGAMQGGDTLSIINTSNDRVTDNLVSGGVTGGIVMSNAGGAFASTESCLNNLIANNIVTNSGNFGIAIEAVTNGGSVIFDTLITGNQVISPGRTGGAGAAPAGIQLSSSTAGLMNGVLVSSNYLHDYSSIAGGFWLTGSGLANATNVVFGANTNLGFAGGSVMSGYPTFASLTPIQGASAFIIDGLAGNCGDGTCTTFGTAVGGGGGALKLQLFRNGSGWSLTGK